MPKFSYKAADASFAEHAGEIEAENLPQAASKLRGTGLFPSSLASDTPPVAQRSLSEAFVVFNRALAGLVKLRLPLSASLRTLSHSVGNRAFRQAISEVADSVERGIPLDEALRQRQDFFPRLYIQLVSAGLASGELSTCLSAIAQDTEERLVLRRMILSELAYPAMVLAFAGAIVGVLAVTAIPSFVSGAAELGVGTPAGLAYLRSNWEAIGVGTLTFCLLFLALWRGRAFEAVRFRLPVIGRFIKALTLTRFYSCLDTLLKSGRFDPSFLVAAASASGSSGLERKMALATERGWEGQPASEVIRSTKFFTTGDVEMIAFGEKTGEFRQAMSDLAHLHREGLKSLVAVISGVLPVAFTLILGVLLGGLYLSLAHPYIRFLTMFKL